MVRKLVRPQVRRIVGLTILVLLAAMGSLSFIRTQAASSIKVQIDKGNGVDNTQETGFNFLVKNTGTAAVSGITVQLYFTPDGSNTASGYTLEKYYDQSNVATISGPTLLSGSTYYFTVNYGTASLAAGGQWEFQTALHLSSWASTYSGANDYYHTGYAVGALPAAYTDTNYILAYVSGTLAWGTAPGSPTNTFVPPATTVVPPPTTVVPTTPAGGLPDLTITSIHIGPPAFPCGISKGTTVVVANQGTGNAGAFDVYVTGVQTFGQNVPSLAAGASITMFFNVTPPNGPITAIVDETNHVAESNENNNTASYSSPTLTPPPCPATSTPGGPTPSRTPTATSSLTPFPLGTAASADLTIHGTVTHTDFGCTGSNTQPMAGVGINVSYNGGTATKVATTDTSGNYSVDLGNVALGTKVTVAPDNIGGIAPLQVFTHNQAENLTLNFNIAGPTGTPCPPTFTPTPGGPLPDLTVTQIQYLGSTPVCANQLMEGITIANIGNADVTTTFILATTFGNVAVNGLAAGASTVIKVSAAGTQTATVDSTNLITESNETNNTKSGNFPIPSQAATCTPTAPPPTSNIVASGTITDACGNGVGIANVEIYVGVITSQLKLAGTTDASGHYSVNFVTAGITNFDGQTVVVLPHFTFWRFTPAYSSWVHAANTNETKTINFQGSTSGTPTATPQFCSATPTQSSITATSTVTPGGPTPTPPPSGTPPANANITLEGFIYDASTLQPIAGATLGNVNTCTPHQPLTTQTDSAGFYVLSIPAVYNCGGLGITASGYATFSIPYTQPYPGVVYNYFLTKGSATPSTPVTNTPTSTATATATLLPCSQPCMDIKIVDFAFQPSSATQKGLPPSTFQFRWTNTGSATHTITADDGSFDSGPLAPGQSFVASVGIQFTLTSNTVTYHCSIHTSMTGSLTVIYPTPTPTPTTAVSPTKTNTPTPTATGSVTPTKTNTPTFTPTKTITPTIINTVVASNTPNGSDPCASATVITGGGTFNVGATATCFKYVNTSFVNGGMFSVMKDGTSASDTIKWYGGMDQNATSCTNQSSTVSGNGGQLNNFTVAKDANGQMFLIVTGSASNSITLSIQNWQNGAGCSVKPTVHP